MHRFFIPPDHIQGSQVILHDAQVHQIRHVLRLEAGAAILVLDNSGWEYEVLLTAVSRNEAQGEITAKRENRAEPIIQLTLYQSLLKRDNFEWILQKGTEIGVVHFVPVITERTVAHPPKKEERWQRILTEAAEQSGRGRLPQLAAPLSLDAALAQAEHYETAVIPWVEEENQTLQQALPPAHRQIAAFIGPEGGFTPDEIALAKAKGVQPVTLGSRILRSETAAIVTSALILHG